MKKNVIFLAVSVFLLISCGSEKQAVTSAANPYLNRYLAADTDTATAAPSTAGQPDTPRPYASQEPVQVEKESLWTDILRHLVEQWGVLK